MYGGGLFQYNRRGVLLIQEFLGIKHSEGKRKDVMDFSSVYTQHASQI
jgi:hypothetical protein